MDSIDIYILCSDSNIKRFFKALEESYIVERKELGSRLSKKFYERRIADFLDKFMELRRTEDIGKRELQEIVHQCKEYIAKTGIAEDADFESISDDSDESLAMPMASVNQSEDGVHRVNCLIVPKDLESLPTLQYRRSCFIAPQTVDLRDYCVATQDQGNRPWCAAYAACAFASNILWRKTDIPSTFDPSPHYHYAKKVDGSPNTDGTTLVAVLQSLLNDKLFLPAHSDVKVLRTIEQVKYAIHKYGCCLIGVTVSKEWYACNKAKSTISGNSNTQLLGGHAVLACGYTRDGIIIQNSWGVDWGNYGFALITWGELEREFVYGAVLDNCLYDMRMN